MYRQPPRNPVPPGWFECPDIGQVSDMHHLIPMKVPLGDNARFPNMTAQYSQGRWTPQIAVDTAAHMILAKNPQGRVGMVLDLSNSDKYYDYVRVEEMGVRYCKVPCRGRGQSPDPLAVNMAVWEIQKTMQENPDYYILVHCTHGFNRSGFIIISALMRLLEKGYCVERGIRHFREQRPPGIYKNDYINDLFARHCEIRPRSHIVPTPVLPEWKPADDEDEDDRLAYTLVTPAPAVAAKMTHADKIGEPVCFEENRYIMNVVYDIIMGQDVQLRMAGMPNAPRQYTLPHMDPKVVNRPNGDLFVGSQPVSLDLQNLGLVKTKRYFVTWKADGTRYLMLIKREGVYLIDRAGEVRRTHMRFPTLLPQPAAKGQHPVGPLHHWTLLDGEMVVDDVDMSGDVQRRRYLVYDCMMLAGEGISDLSFGERYQLIDKQILRPLGIEKEFYRKYPNPKFLYDWNLELCSIRRKEFWPLYKAKKLVEDFIPRLCHESDGLILQPWDDPYIPRTYPHLLKWKFSHMNSVDFKLFALPDQPVRLQLNCGTRRKYGQAEVNHMSLQDIGLGDQRVEFPAHVNPCALHGKIVECNFNAELRVWTYMRDRPDKPNANHRSVFDKVMASIFDNIDEEKLLGVFDEALETRPDIYKQEKEWINNPQAVVKPPATAVAAQDGHTPQQQSQQPQQQPGHAQQQLELPQQQQEHSQQQQQWRQQRSQTPEVRQLQQQQQLRPGLIRPSPICTPPPGAPPEGDTGRIQNGRLADSAGLVDDLTPGLEAAADGADGTAGGEGEAADGDMEEGEEGDMVDYDPELHDGDGMDDDAEYMQDYDEQYEQQETVEHDGAGDYKVTEEDVGEEVEEHDDVPQHEMDVYPPEGF